MLLKNKSVFIFTLICVLLFATGFLVRYYVLATQYKVFGYPLPFDLESAIEYRYVEMLYSAGRLPELDKAIEWPYGVNPHKNLEIGAEYVYAFLAKMMPKSIPLEDRVRLLSIGWFSLGIVFMAIWIKSFTGSIMASFLGTLYYAIGIASVMRSTGQELSHENFALPLLILYMAINSVALNTQKQSVLLTASAFAAISLAIAMTTWDLIQYPLMLFNGISLIKAVLCRLTKAETSVFSFSLLALILAGLINPYLATHSFLLSPSMLLGYAGLIALLLNKIPVLQTQNIRNILIKVTVALIPFFTSIIFASSYWQNYGHFTELLLAKLKFLNKKPADPALLTFNQRILWTPALDSVNLELTFYLFPAILFPSFFAAILLVRRAKHFVAKEGITLVVFFVVSLITFFLFKRFLVFLAICCAGLCGWLFKDALSEKNLLKRTVIITCLIVCVVLEGTNSISNPSQWGHKISYLTQRKELIEWITKNLGGEPVLANFGLSAYLLAYGGCPIVLHPKYESVRNRKRIEEYGKALFLYDEDALRRWCASNRVSLLVYSMGEFYPYFEELQMRYFINALNPSPSAPARIFEFSPDKSRYFIKLWENSKYRVFRVITPFEEARAIELARESTRLLQLGKTNEALIKAEEALMYDPKGTSPHEAIFKINTRNDTSQKNE